SRANHRRPADVDLLDCLFSSDSFTPDRFGKRIEINHHHIDGFDMVLLHCGNMLWIVSQRKQAPMNARMQCLNSSIHHLRETGDVGNVSDSDAGCSQSLCSTTGTDDLHVEFT